MGRRASDHSCKSDSRERREGRNEAVSGRCRQRKLGPGQWQSPGEGCPVGVLHRAVMVQFLYPPVGSHWLGRPGEVGGGNVVLA